METGYTIVVGNSDVLISICGSNDNNLAVLETYLGAPLVVRGNELTLLSSDAEICRKFQILVDKIIAFSSGNSGNNDNSGFYDFSAVNDRRFLLDCGYSSENIPVLDETILTGIINSLENPHDEEFPMNSCIDIPHSYRKIFPKTLKQAEFFSKVKTSDVVFCEGPAGTGKTFLVLAEALYLLLSKRVQKIVLTRPVVEAGENLGFLPGDLEQKLNPYLRPLYDAMEKILPREVIRRLMDSSAIEAAPLAYMRGRSIDNAAVVLDEGQNTTKGQMKMFLTRLGENSKAFVTGDLSQVDLPRHEVSGFSHALEVLKNIEEIAIISFGHGDVVRVPIVKKIIQAYEQKKK